MLKSVFILLVYLRKLSAFSLAYVCVRACAPVWARKMFVTCLSITISVVTNWKFDGGTTVPPFLCCFLSLML